MSALGDYIHLSYNKYHKYGTARGPEETRFYKTFKDEMQNRYQITKIEDEILNELQNRIKENTPHQIAEDKINAQELSKIRQEAIYALLADKIRSWRPGVISNEKIKLPFFEKETSSLFKDYKRLLDQYKTIIEKINELNKKESVSQDDLSKSAAELVKKYEHLTGQVFKNKNGTAKSVIGAIEQSLINQAYDSIQGNITGYFGELLVAACGDAAYQEGREEVIKAIKEGVQGESRSDIIIEEEIFSKQVPLPFSHRTSDGTSYSLGGSQDKIDVTISVNKVEIKSSVKAYSGHRLSLQEINLFYPVTFLNTIFQDFGNHWLNLHAARREKLYSTDQKNKEDADEILRQEVILQALAKGNPFKSSELANVFVYININTGECIVKNIADILNKYKSESDSKIFGMKNDVSLFHFSNIKASTPEERIGNILNQLHGSKIKVSINTKQILG